MNDLSKDVVVPDPFEENAGAAAPPVLEETAPAVTGEENPVPVETPAPDAQPEYQPRERRL